MGGKTSVPDLPPPALLSSTLPPVQLQISNHQLDDDVDDVCCASIKPSKGRHGGFSPIRQDALTLIQDGQYILLLTMTDLGHNLVGFRRSMKLTVWRTHDDAVLLRSIYILPDWIYPPPISSLWPLMDSTGSYLLFFTMDQTKQTNEVQAQHQCCPQLVLVHILSGEKVSVNTMPQQLQHYEHTLHVYGNDILVCAQEHDKVSQEKVAIMQYKISKSPSKPHPIIKKTHACEHLTLQNFRAFGTATMLQMPYCDDPPCMAVFQASQILSLCELLLLPPSNTPRYGHHVPIQPHGGYERKLEMPPGSEHVIVHPRYTPQCSPCARFLVATLVKYPLEQRLAQGLPFETRTVVWDLRTTRIIASYDWEGDGGLHPHFGNNFEILVDDRDLKPCRLDVSKAVLPAMLADEAASIDYAGMGLAKKGGSQCLATIVLREIVLEHTLLLYRMILF